ncbi:MAG: hypothetical protein KAI25_07410, partial [Hyphomicrobiaceae bacterium]|nr:hypothetical protein [Hyphomicrobiaceae bacterium]
PRGETAQFLPHDEQLLQPTRKTARRQNRALRRVAGAEAAGGYWKSRPILTKTATSVIHKPGIDGNQRKNIHKAA